MKRFLPLLRSLAALLFACEKPDIGGPDDSGGGKPGKTIPVESVKLDVSAKELIPGDCPVLGLPYTDAQGSLHDSYPHFGFNASHSVNISQCPEITGIYVPESTTKIVHINDCRKLYEIILGEGDIYQGDLEDLSVTNCPNLFEANISSSKLNGVMPASLQQVMDHIGYRSPTFPIKYKYGIEYTQEGDHGLPNSNGPYKVYLEKHIPMDTICPESPDVPMIISKNGITTKTPGVSDNLYLWCCES